MNRSLTGISPFGERREGQRAGAVALCHRSELLFPKSTLGLEEIAKKLGAFVGQHAGGHLHAVI